MKITIGLLLLIVIFSGCTQKNEYSQLLLNKLKPNELVKFTDIFPVNNNSTIYFIGGYMSLEDIKYSNKKKLEKTLLDNNMYLAENRMAFLIIDGDAIHIYGFNRNLLDFGHKSSKSMLPHNFREKSPIIASEAKLIRITTHRSNKKYIEIYLGEINNEL